MDYLEKFNTTFNEFIDDIIRIFPNDEELKMYKAALRTAVCLNDKMIINIFNETIVNNYESQLLSRDETFFLNYDYTEVVSNDYIAILNKIKKCWSLINENDRNNVWKYFKVLILLSKKIAI
jgi:hypothetical protein